MRRQWKDGELEALRIDGVVLHEAPLVVRERDRCMCASVFVVAAVAR
jgi:hypothetical protein